MLMHLEKQAQIRALLFDKAFTFILVEYSNYSNVFLTENAAGLSKHTRINNHTLKLKADKELLFRSIYSLELVKLEILKIYIKTNLANSFI